MHYWRPLEFWQTMRRSAPLSGFVERRHCSHKIKPSPTLVPGCADASLTSPENQSRQLRRPVGSVHYGAARSANSVTTVRANQLPRAVSRAYALPWSTLSVSMPSRPRSATVAPEMGLSPTLADGTVQIPHRL